VRQSQKATKGVEPTVRYHYRMYMAVGWGFLAWPGFVPGVGFVRAAFVLRGLFPCGRSHCLAFSTFTL
jgi:hypothetical protein